jgi:hypothetical protein
MLLYLHKAIPLFCRSVAYRIVPAVVEALDRSNVSSKSRAKAPSWACKTLTLDLWLTNDAIVVVINQRF